MRHSVIRIAALAAAISVMAALPATAGAATTGPGGGFGAATLTVSVGKATLSQKLVVNVPVTVKCTLNPGAPEGFPQQGTNVGVTIVEAIGRKTATGSGYASGFACDGMPHTFAMQILAEPTASGGLHFQKGVAAVQATASAYGYDANFMYGTDSATIGWQTLRIK